MKLSTLIRSCAESNSIKNLSIICILFLAIVVLDSLNQYIYSCMEWWKCGNFKLQCICNDRVVIFLKHFTKINIISFVYIHIRTLIYAHAWDTFILRWCISYYGHGKVPKNQSHFSFTMVNTFCYSCISNEHNDNGWQFTKLNMLMNIY